jgi:Na+-transporting NADH:ubiquinone oxidoreductase subunit NqrC
MEKAKTILIILILTLVAGVLFLALRSYGLTLQLNNNIALNKEIKVFFQNAEVKCTATEQEPEKLTRCLQSLNKKLKGIDVAEAVFSPVDKNGNPGYFIVKNNAIKPLNSTDFTLLKNLELVSTGCDNLNGTMGKDYTCKLTFDTPCERGDVLEVQYQGLRAIVKTC